MSSETRVLVEVGCRTGKSQFVREPFVEEPSMQMDTQRQSMNSR